MKYYSFLSAISFLLSITMHAQKTYLFAGGYTKDQKGEGIQVFEFDTENGHVSKVSSIDDIVNAGYFELNSEGTYLYTCNDLGWEKEGKVSVYAFNSQTLSFDLKQQLNSEGHNPCHVAIDGKNQKLAISNYTQSSGAVFNILSNGNLKEQPTVFKFEGNSIMKSRQEASHVHSANFSPDSKLLYLQDLGLDKIHAICLTKNEPEVSKKYSLKTTEGAGPRHFTFHPNGKFAYTINELNGTVSSYCYKKGRLKEIDTDFSYSKKQDSYGSADIHISPDGKFLYTSNRWENENTIAIFKIDSKNGNLELVGHQSTHGDHPRNFVIDPSGNFLLVANRNTNNIVFFKRDQTTGLLTKTEQEIKMNEPTCLKFQSYR